MPKPILSVKTRTKSTGNLKRLMKRAKGLSGVHSVQAGFLPDAKNSDGQPIAPIAAIQEFGAQLPKGGAIPERPFMRRANQRIPIAAREILRRRVDPETMKVDRLTAEAVGQSMTAEIRQAIDDTNEPANAPRTRGRKRRNQPLIDTGAMYEAVDYQVQE